MVALPSSLPFTCLLASKNKQLFILIQAQTHNSTPEHDFSRFVFSFYIRNF